MSDAAKQSSTNPITELKVSGHLMTMEEGLFCVYNTPGSASPDAATGLPGVRLTAAPGQGGFSGRVSISGFGGDGWLAGADGAVLVRILGGAAQVLVTVYQAADGAHDAPKLQVIRLTDEPAAQAAKAPAVAATPAEQLAQQEPVAGPPLEVAAHIYGRGDVGGRLGDWMGDPGSKRWIEGFGLAPSGGVAAADIEYQAVLGRGWLSPWAEGGQFCGSRGMSLPILGLRVRLRGAAAASYKVAVSATFVDGSKVGPVTDGAACEAPSLSPLEAFNVSLRPVADAAAAQAPSAKPAARRTAKTRGAAPDAAPAVQPESGKRVKRGQAPTLAVTPPPKPQAPAKRGKVSALAAMAPPPPREPQKPSLQKPSLQKPGPQTPLKPTAKPPAKRTPATTRRR